MASRRQRLLRGALDSFSDPPAPAVPEGRGERDAGQTVVALRKIMAERAGQMSSEEFWTLSDAAFLLEDRAPTHERQPMSLALLRLAFTGFLLWSVYLGSRAALVTVLILMTLALELIVWLILRRPR